MSLIGSLTPKKQTRGLVPVDSALLNSMTPMAIKELGDNTLLIGDSYKKILCITNYPSHRKDAAWLDGVFALPFCIVSIDCIPADKTQLIKAANREDRLVEFISSHKYASTSEKMGWQQSLDNSETVIKTLSEDKEEMFNVIITIVISAPDLDELKRREKIVYQKLKTKKLDAKSITGNQLPSYLATSPYCCEDTAVFEQCARPMPLLTVASTMPFTVPGIDDGKGCNIGFDTRGGKCRIDMLEQNRIYGRSNSNFVTFGAQGVGKSTLANKIIDHAIVIKRSDVVVFDPEREFKEHLEKQGGTWIDIGHGGISPFALRYGADEVEDAAEDSTQIKPVLETVRFLRVFFSIAVELTDIDLSYLEAELEKQYLRFGLSRDMGISQCKKTMRGRKAAKEAIHPEPKDVFDGLMIRATEEDKAKRGEESKIYKALAMKIRPVCVGSYSDLWGGQTDMDEVESFDVVGYDTVSLTRYDMRIRAAQYYNYLSWEWTRLQDAHLSGSRRQKLIYLGEAHFIINSEIPQAGHLVRQIAVGIRKRGGSLGIDTHFPDNLLADGVKDTGQAIIDGATFKYLFGVSAQSLKRLHSLFNLNEDIETELAQQIRGKCLVLAGAQSALVNVSLSAEEKAFYGDGGGK